MHLPLFNVLLQTVGRHFSQVLGSQSGECDPSVFDQKNWPMTARRIILRIEIMRALHKAHDGSHRALALPGICALVLKPFWYFEVDYRHQKFWNTTKSYRMPDELQELIDKAAAWTTRSTGLSELFTLTMSTSDLAHGE